MQNFFRDLTFLDKESFKRASPRNLLNPGVESNGLCTLESCGISWHYEGVPLHCNHADVTSRGGHLQGAGLGPALVQFEVEFIF